MWKLEFHAPKICSQCIFSGDSTHSREMIDPLEMIHFGESFRSDTGVTPFDGPILGVVVIFDLPAHIFTEADSLDDWIFGGWIWNLEYKSSWSQPMSFLSVYLLFISRFEYISYAPSVAPLISYSAHSSAIVYSWSNYFQTFHQTAYFFDYEDHLMTYMCFLILK